MSYALDELNVWELGGLVASIATVAQRGLLAPLAAGPVALEPLARAADVPPEPLAAVLAVLVQAGLAHEDARGYALRADLARALVEGPGGVDAMVRLWAHTPRFVAEGARVARMDGTPADRAGAYQTTARGLGALFAGAAERLAQALDAPFGAVLDVGAGSGVWSLAMAARDPEAHVTALDLEPVLPRFRERAADLGLGARVATLAADFHEAALAPASFDTLVLANVLHLEGAPRAEAMLARTVRWLRPGGRVVIVETPAPDVGARGLAAAAYALHLSMRTAHGRAQPEGELRAWLARVGLGEIDRIDLHEALHGMLALVAREPTARRRG